MIYVLWATSAVSWLLMRIKDPERWRAFKDREGGMGPLPPFSRLDTMVYALFGLTFFYAIAMTLFRTTEVSEQTERNTKEMGGVVEKMRTSSDRSLEILVAMRDEADAARRETKAAQKLALWVGVGTAIVGAILGGIAGAFAADALN